MRMDFTGNTFTLFVDDVKLADVVDDTPTYYRAGRVGIEAGALLDTHFDDFSVTTFDR
jgi:hypothetical protein